MTRIRYKNVNGELVSNEILCGNELNIIGLNTNELSYKIWNNSGIVKTGTANSLQMLKRTAKLVLKELGANFNDEIRSRDKKLELNENQG